MALASDCSATYAIREGSRFASLHSSTSLAPATTAQIQNVVTQNLFMPNAVSIAVGVYYGGGNAINGEVGIGLTWNQQVNIPFFKNQSLAMNVATYRWITR